MTPERAEEIAVRIRADYAISMGAKEAIKQAIIQACAEQRETDAKICEEHYTIEGIAQRCAAAIREGK
jgi:hypothetical protein